MKVSPKETLRKLFGDNYLYLMLLIEGYNDNIINRLKENQEEISKYLKMKLKIKLNVIFNRYLDTLILIIHNLNDFNEKEQEYKEKLLHITKEISQLISSKKLQYMYKSSIKFLFKSLKSKIDNNHKKQIDYYDNFINNQIKLSDIIYKIILNNKHIAINNNYRKKKGGCKLLGDITCRCK